MLLTTMRSTITRYHMFVPGDHVVVAVSGGADSVALLHALCELSVELELRLTVAHLNHGLRGEAARQEAEFVKELTHSLAVPCVCEQRDVRADQQARGECLQEAARTVRYRFFADVLRRCKAQKLALGHTMDDQAETVLIRLLRGASTHGLGGIPPTRPDGIVRPLINVRRTTIERFLRERDIAFVPDSSAHEPQYLRNRIRHELMPLLAGRYNPRVVEALCTTAALARDDEAILRDAAARATDTEMQTRAGAVHFPVRLLERHPLLAGRIVRRALEMLRGSCRGLTSGHAHAVLALTSCKGSNRQVPIPGGLVVRREYEELIMAPAHEPAAHFHVQVNHLPADVRLPQINARVQVRTLALADTAALQRPTDSDTLYLAPDSITLPLIIRSWQPGDRIRPFGFNAEKKVKAVFAEEKIPVRLRGRVPLLESGGRIMCVGALRMAEHCRVAPGCRTVIAVTVTDAAAD